MCTPIVEIIEAEGAGKGGEGWFAMSHAVVSYDHPHQALLDEAITIDFVNNDRGPGVRAAVEMTLESAKALVTARPFSSGTRAQYTRPPSVRTGCTS